MGFTGTERGMPSLIARETPAHTSRFSDVEPLTFRRSPMLVAAICFALGILLAHAWRPAAAMVCATTALILLGACAIRYAPRLAISCTLLMWTSLGWTCAELRPPLLPEAKLLLYADGLRRDAIGEVVQVQEIHHAPQREEDRDGSGASEITVQPEDVSAPEHLLRIQMKIRSMEEVSPQRSIMVPASGGVQVNLYAPAASIPELRCGNIVRLTLRMRPPTEFRDPGVWRYPDYLAGQGISATASAQANDLYMLGTQRAPLSCTFAATQQWATQRMLRFVHWERRMQLPSLLRWTDVDAGQVDAMLVGDRTALDRDLRTQFERTGTFHLFVVAGMHVGIVAGAAYSLLLLMHMRRSAAALIAMLVTTAYALVTGFGAPVQRALLMTLAYMAARWLARENSVLNAIGAAALGMLVLRPQSLYEASFQMTVLVAFAIGGIARPFLERSVAPYARACRNIHLLRIDPHMPPRLAQFRTTIRMVAAPFGNSHHTWPEKVLAGAVWVTLLGLELTVLSSLAEMAMSLTMAFYFHRVTPLALPANLLVVPLLPVLMCLAIATFLLAMVSFWMALLPGLFTACLLHWTTAVVRGIGTSRNADWRIETPSGLAMITGAALLTGAILLLRLRRRSFAWVGAAFTPMVMLAVLVPWHSNSHHDAMELTAIDVGQGDAILLRAPNGMAMLVDAGGQAGTENTERRTSFDIGEQVVSPFLWNQGIRRLDLMVLTHAHMDHIGGMAAVLRNFRPRELWISVDAPSATLILLEAEAKEMGVTLRRLHGGDRSEWYGIPISVLSPPQTYRAGDAPANDDSLVLRAEYGKSSVLLEGDAEQGSEQKMIEMDELAAATLLKVGHHGSNSSTSEDWLRRVHPKAAVISCGRGNHFGHPRMSVLQRLQLAHVLTSRTDTMGAVQYRLHRDGSFETHILSSNFGE